MNTTELYVEYIIIGLETLCWIFLIFIIALGQDAIDFFAYCISNVFPSIGLIGFCYILGLVMDRISDNIFEQRKILIKKKYKMKSKTSLIVWDKYGQASFAKFTLSRIRILRSTIINSVLIAIAASVAVYRCYRTPFLFYLVLFLCLGVAIASNSAHKYLLDNYYKKTSILDTIVNKKS